MKTCKNGHHYYFFHWQCRKEKVQRAIKPIIIHHKNKFKIDRKLDKIEQRKEELFYYWIKSPQCISYEDVVNMDTELGNLYKQAEELI